MQFGFRMCSTSVSGSNSFSDQASDNVMRAGGYVNGSPVDTPSVDAVSDGASGIASGGSGGSVGEQISQILHDRNPSRVLNFSLSNPGICIDGFGELPLPLNELTVKHITALHPAKAPVGEGISGDTVPRSHWELPASQFSIANPDWELAVDEAVEIFKLMLGMGDCRVEAKLSKLLICQPGDPSTAPRLGE